MKIQITDIWRRVDWHIVKDVSKDFYTSIFKVLEKELWKLFGNIGNYVSV
jgi:hypothetical protein